MIERDVGGISAVRVAGHSTAEHPAWPSTSRMPPALGEVKSSRGGEILSPFEGRGLEAGKAANNSFPYGESPERREYAPIRGLVVISVLIGGAEKAA